MVSGKSRFKSVLCMAMFLGSVHAFSQSENSKEEEYSLEAMLNTEIHAPALARTAISSAAKYKQRTRDVAASATVITSMDIARYGYATLDEIFQSIPGFYSSYDRNYSYIGVRGFGRPTDYNNRILMLVDGRAINDNFYGAVGTGPDFGIDLQRVERIEIVRGPGSALYGSHAMFAVVNIVLKKVNNFDGFKVHLNTGSYGHRGQSAAFGKEFENGIGLIVSNAITDIRGQDHYYPDFDDPATNNGIASGVDWEKYYSMASELSYKTLSISYLFNMRKKGIPTASYETVFNYPQTLTEDGWGLFSIKYNHVFSPSDQLQLTGSYNHFSYFGIWPYEWEEDDGEMYLSEYYDSDIGKWFSGEIQLIHDFSSNHRLTIGTEYKKNVRSDFKSWDEDGTYFDQNFPYSSYSFYAQDEYLITKSSALTLGVRYDDSTIGWNAISPRAGFVHHIFDETTVKFLYGEAFRAPSLYEVYYEDFNAGYKQNRNLKPEKIRALEFSLEHDLAANINGTFSAYNNKITNLIDQGLDTEDELIQHDNISHAEASGIELSLNFRNENQKSGFISYSLQSGKDGETGSKMSNSPSHLIKAGLVLPLFNKFFVATQFFYESERIAVVGGEADKPAKTKPYTLANMAITSKLLRKHFKLSFKIRNVLNQDYALPGGFEHVMSSIKQDKRNYRIGLSFVY